MSGLDPTYPSIPVFSFLGFVVALIPLPWMLQSWNVGACAFSIWAALQCLDDFIRLVVWRDNFNNVAPVYCDICQSILFSLSYVNLNLRLNSQSSANNFDICNPSLLLGNQPPALSDNTTQQHRSFQKRGTDWLPCLKDDFESHSLDSLETLVTFRWPFYLRFYSPLKSASVFVLFRCRGFRLQLTLVS